MGLLNKEVGQPHFFLWKNNKKHHPKVVFNFVVMRFLISA